MRKRKSMSELSNEAMCEQVLAEYDRLPYGKDKTMIQAVRNVYPEWSVHEQRRLVTKINSDPELTKKYRDKLNKRRDALVNSVVLTVEERKQFLSRTILDENIGIKSRLEAVKILNHMENVGGNSNTVNIMNLSIEEKREEVRKQIAGLLNGKHE